MKKSIIDTNDEIMKMSVLLPKQQLREIQQKLKEQEKKIKELENKLSSEKRKNEYEVDKVKILTKEKKEIIEHKNYYYYLALPNILKGCEKFDRCDLPMFVGSIISCVCPTTKQIHFLEIEDYDRKRNSYAEAVDLGLKLSSYDLANAEDVELHYKSENYDNGENKELQKGITYKLLTRYIVRSRFDFNKNMDKKSWN